MERLFGNVIKWRKKIIIIFLVLCAVSAVTRGMVSVNYDINSYLPDETASSVALDVMQEEFAGGIPNAKVMIEDVTITEALEYKEQLMDIKGVEAVTWLDDQVDIKQPLEFQDQDTVEQYYKDDTALFSVTISSEDNLTAVEDIRELIGEDNSMAGTAVSKAMATINTEKEILKITALAIVFGIIILIVTTTSWAEPFIVMLGLGVAILINMGTHMIFGEISFVTAAAGNILQLAVSMDYSVFLIHRFTEFRKEAEQGERVPAGAASGKAVALSIERGVNPTNWAMHQALVKTSGSILASGMTTVIGFMALVLMRFEIGPDLGLALAKGVVISLITVFFFMPGFILMTYKFIDKTQHRPFVPDLKGFGRLVKKIMIPCAIVFTIIIVPAYMASNANSYHFGSSQIYGPDTQIGREAAEIKDTFGKGDTYVLMVPKGDTATEKALSDELNELEQVEGILSFVDLAGAQVPYEYLDESQLALLESDNYSRMVISVDVDYEGDETLALISQIKEIAQEYYPDNYHLAGEGISTSDLRDTVMEDLLKVNIVAIIAVFLVLLLTMRNMVLPIILVMTIETAIWINLATPYFMGDKLFYIAYLLVTSIQLGATVDYAILMTQRYRENRQVMSKGDSIVHTVATATPSILTSGFAMTVVGFLMNALVTHGIIAQLGLLLGRGTLCSVIAVLFVLPGYLYLTDKFIVKKQEVKLDEA